MKSSGHRGSWLALALLLSCSGSTGLGIDDGGRADSAQQAQGGGGGGGGGGAGGNSVGAGGGGPGGAGGNGAGGGGPGGAGGSMDAGCSASLDSFSRECAPTLAQQLAQPPSECGCPNALCQYRTGSCGGYAAWIVGTGYGQLTCLYTPDGSRLVAAQRCTDYPAYCGGFCIGAGLSDFSFVSGCALPGTPVCPAPGTPCSAGDDCGDPTLACSFGVSQRGTCQHCGAPGEICCGRAGGSQSCQLGYLCLVTAGTPGSCVAP